MAQSTAIMLAVGAIGAGNEWLHGNNDAAAKIGVAAMATAVIFAGVEQIPGVGRPFAVGLSVIALIGVVFGGLTPGVPSPAVQILDYMGYKK